MLLNDNEYISAVKKIKDRIREAQHKAMLSVNSELLLLYWDIGEMINSRKEWGKKFIDNLSRDILSDFPNAKGYSARNLIYMAQFAATYPSRQFTQQLVAQIPWGHNTYILDTLKDEKQRIWYIEKTIENGWSRSVLAHQIETDLYSRQATAIKATNFAERLSAPQSELAVQTMKDPYIFDFISFKQKIEEREIESTLVKNITEFLLELGTGFAFLGNQYHLNVGGEDFYIDLLFYNINLKCYVVIELKAVEFKPEFAGKLNFYISAVDGILKKENDNPTIGLLLCKEKNNIVAEYSLKRIASPMGVSEYKIGKELPKEYEGVLPTTEDIKNRIG